MQDKLDYFSSQIKNWKLKKALIITVFILFIFPIPWITAILLFIFLENLYWLKIIFLILPVISIVIFVLLGKYYFYKKYGVNSENIAKLFNADNKKFQEFFENQEENINLDEKNSSLELLEVEAKDPEKDHKQEEDSKDKQKK